MRWLAVEILEWVYHRLFDCGRAYYGIVWWTIADWLKWAIRKAGGR